MRNSKNKNNNEGFALLIAVLVSGVLVSITYVMFSIGLKQLSLSTASKQSQIAFYAADSGLECALYFDFVESQIFEQHTEDTDPVGGIDVIFSAPGSQPSISCYGSVDNINQSLISAKEVNTTFRVKSYSGNMCSVVKVVKTVNRKEVGGTFGHIDSIVTSVESLGYNICPDGNPNPLRVERGLIVNY